MNKYRKVPVVIEAFRFGYELVPDWFTDKETENIIILYCDEYDIDESKMFCIIETLEGAMRGDYGDWIIKGVAGEIYPCKHDIFVQTYDPFVDDDA